MPEEYGGGGVDDFRFNAVIDEEIARYGGPAPSMSLQNDIVGPYSSSLATDEQKQRWLPGIISGELIVAVAMTEPGAGSDLAGIRTSAVRDGDDWIINGSKTFISSGINCDLVVVVCRTDPEAGHKGFTLLIVEAGMEGFSGAASWKRWACITRTPPSLPSTTSACRRPTCSARRAAVSTI